MDWRLRVGMLSGLLVLSHAAARGEAPPDPYKAMTVVICNQARLDANTFTVAKTKTTQIFETADIKLTWIEACQFLPVLPNYFVVVIARESPPGWTSPDAMGIAPARAGDQRRAYVFLSRVKTFLEIVSRKDTRSSTVGTAIGLAMGHELGHLLLPGDAHSMWGIMNPCWNWVQWQDAMRGNLSFLPDQVHAMQRELDSIAAHHDSRLAGIGSLR
jgi:hypothetical protein